MRDAPTDVEFEVFLEGLRRGDAVVLHEFIQQYRPALERLARRRLDRGLLARTGPESVAQSVCRTFLRRAGEGQFDLVDSSALWGLLCAMTLTKARERSRFHRRRKRAIDRECQLDAGLAATSSGADPSAATDFADELERTLSGFTGQVSQILELRLFGQSQAEIAEALSISERTVRRRLRDAEAQLRADLEGNAGPASTQ